MPVVGHMAEWGGENAVHKQQQEMRKCNNIYEKHSVSGGEICDCDGDGNGECKRKLRPEKMGNVREQHAERSGEREQFLSGNCHCLQIQILHMSLSPSRSTSPGHC